MKINTLKGDKMAIRSIRTIGDPILEKKTKPVKEMTDRIKDLISDMFETMYEANGVGLAAPQVGILKQLFVVDIGDGKQYVEKKCKQERRDVFPFREKKEW